MASWTCCETPDLIARQIDAVRPILACLKPSFPSAMTISKIPVLVSDARYRRRTVSSLLFDFLRLRLTH
jgi:hypothetical protein